MVRDCQNEYKDSIDMVEKRVEKIFDNISTRYDITNSIISLGIERYWRFRFNSLINGNEEAVLDACCGTGTSSFEIWEKTKRNALISGLDISGDMLQIARERLKKIKRGRSKAKGDILFKKADIENTGFQDNQFDLITIIFGIRNVGDRQKALKELYRVSRPGARLLCMEFNNPQIKLFRRLYSFYLDNVLVKFGTAITGNRDAYMHLAKSIKEFPQPLDFSGLLENCGWEDISIYMHTFKTCMIYEARKK